MTGLTPSQTVGPYFRIGLDWPDAWRLATDKTPGESLTLVGRVLDGDGQPVGDALVEVWQADADGRYPSPGAQGFSGLGRCGVDAEGEFRFVTVKPGAVAAPDGGLQAPHLNLVVMARGLLTHLFTRVYFPGDEAVQDVDPMLARVPAARRATLLARRDGDVHRFDIHLQGEHETVFFAL